MNENRKVRKLVALGLAIFSGLMPTLSLIFTPYTMFNDGEILPDGRYMICQFEIIRRDGYPSYSMETDAVIIVNATTGKIDWSLGVPEVHMDQPHEALMTDHNTILTADCRNDSVLEFDINTSKEVWRYDLRTINWTAINDTLFPADHFVNNPHGDDFTHVNDVELREENGTEYLLFSIRNFDMLLEINYTAARAYNDTNEEDVTWYYGYPGNHTLLNQQHNPDYLPNGNIMTADSENDRITEIDYDTKEFVWISPPDLNLYWPRDADVNPYDPTNNTILITDSLNHRVIEYNRSSNEIIWSYTGSLVQPYQADYVNETHVVIADGVGGAVILLDKTTNTIVWQYITPIRSTLLILAVLVPVEVFLVILISFMLYDKIKLKRNKKRRHMFNLISAIIWLVFVTIFMFQPHQMIKPIIYTIDQIRR